MINRLAHFTIGLGVGLFAHRPAALTATQAFIAYQGIEAYSKGDKGYPEVRQFAWGFGVGLALRYIQRHPDKRRTALAYLRALCETNTQGR